MSHIFASVGEGWDGKYGDVAATILWGLTPGVTKLLLNFFSFGITDPICYFYIYFIDLSFMSLPLFLGPRGHVFVTDVGGLLCLSGFVAPFDANDFVLMELFLKKR